MVNKFQELKSHSFTSNLKYLFFLLLFGTLFYVPTFNMGIFSLKITDVLLGCFFLLTFLYAEKNSLKEFRGYKVFFIILFIYYLFIICFSFLKGNDYHQIFGRFRNLFIYPLIFLSGLVLSSTEDSNRKFLNCLLGGYLFFVILGISNLISIYLTGNHLPFYDGYLMVINQRMGIFSLILFVFYSLSFIKQKNLKTGFILFICIFSIVGSQNRTLLILYLCTLLFLGFYMTLIQKKYKTFLKFALLIILSVIVSLAGILNSTVVTESLPKPKLTRAEKTQKKHEVYRKNTRSFKRRYTNMAKELRGNRQVGQLKMRIARVKTSLKNWVKSPIFGVGWGNQANETKIFHKTKKKLLKHLKGTPHNYYVALLEQTGIIGFLLMVGFFLSMFRLLVTKINLKESSNLKISYMVFFVGFMIYNLVNVFIYATSSFIMVSFFLLGVITRYFVSHEKSKDRIN